MAIAKLKPCPRCSSKHVGFVAWDNGDRDVYKGECHECGFEAPEYSPNKTAAARAWNGLPRAKTKRDPLADLLLDMISESHHGYLPYNGPELAAKYADKIREMCS